MIIKDSMVLIHLAKTTVLERSCDYFGEVLIPEKVYREIMEGKNKEYGDVEVIEEIIKNKKINVKRIKNKRLINRANQYNIQGGEAEALALYWQEEADYLATDDDNVRRKSYILNFNIIGTPAIMLKLYERGIISKEKFMDSIKRLKSIGWFSSAVIDKMMMEVENGTTDRNKVA